MTQPKKRYDFLDDARAFAVLAMIVWHTADAWMITADKHGPIYWIIALFGGIAAPLFVFLAGASVAIALDRSTDRQTTVHTLMWRGLQIVVLGYALRLQMWVIDSWAIADPQSVFTWGPLVVGLVAAIYGTGRDRKFRSRMNSLGFATLLYAIGLWRLYAYYPEAPSEVLRVDVLQLIGASIVLLSVFFRAISPVLIFLLASALCLLTLEAQRYLPGALPHAFAAYLAKWPSDVADNAICMFPIMPWLAYALIGFGVAKLWRLNTSGHASTLSFLLTLVVGGVAFYVSDETKLYIANIVRDSPATLQWFRVVRRAGFCCGVVGFSFFMSRKFRSRLWQMMGQTSLLIYWIHLQIAYGTLGRPLQSTLTMTQWAIAATILTLSMFGLAYLVRTQKPRH